MKGSFPQAQTHVNPSGRKATNPIRGLLPIALLLGIVNLLLMNDLTTLLPMEAKWLLTEEGFSLPLQLLKGLESLGISDIFGLRLPTALLYLGSGALLYLYGQKLFGKDSTSLSLLVLLSSPLFIGLGKFSSGDGWLLLMSIAHALSLLYLIKAPQRKHYWVYGSTIALGWWVATWEFATFGLALGLFLRWLHPQGKEMGKRLSIFWLWPILYFALYFSPFGERVNSSLLLSHHTVSIFYYLLFVLLVLLPWLGFLAGGIVELVRNSPKREEISLILLSWLLAGLFSYSIALVPILALIAGRQALRYFREGYPRRPLVRGLHIIGLVATFFGAMWLMMEGFRLLRGTGFRIAMITTLVYWMLSFLAIFGLFLRKPRFSWSTLTGSGLLLTFLAWALLNPLIEQWRGFPRLVIEEVKQEKVLAVPTEVLATWPALKWYAEKEGVRIQSSQTSSPWMLQQLSPKDSSRIHKEFSTNPYDPNQTYFLLKAE
jgi:4-amino-4-deoxy-L-arabinose transferase-like glycosyltransferase